MSAKAAGSKAGRRERHLARQAALKERKVLRRKRAAIHAAMTEAARMKRSKKRGCADFEQNMRALGYEGYRLDPGDVLRKYEARS